MKMSKIAAIVAAAALLVIGAAFTSMAATYDWQLENGEWVCYDKDGYQYYDTWAQSASGDWYFLGDEGVMATNQKLQWKETSKYVYVGADGSIQKDAWVKIDNDDEDNTYDWYRFGSNGYMLANKKAVIDGKTYFFGADGKMLTGWVAASGSEYSEAVNKNTDGIYYCNGKEDGSAVIGDWKKIDIKANEDDDAKEVWFYFQTSGRMFKATTAQGLATKKINGEVYAFNEYGEMQSKWLANATAGIATYSYFSDPEVGARVSKGWFQAYAQNETQERIDDGEASLNWYYAISAGKLAKSQIKKINGKYYCFNADGVMQSGLVWVQLASGSDWDFNVVSATTNLTADNFETEIKKGYAANYSLYYFSGDGAKDGSMKFGTQKVTCDDEEFTLYFNNSSTSARGTAINTRTTKGIYYNGVKLAASAEARYVFLKATIASDGKVENIEGAPKYAYELVGKNEGYVVLNSAGRVLTSLNSKDGDGYTVKLSNGLLEITE